jgi:phosphoserine aminotransferase
MLRPRISLIATPMRAFNFAAGPAALPTEVLEEVRSELLDWRGSGSSVMEVSHRSDAFVEVAQDAERDLRELLGIPVIIACSSCKAAPAPNSPPSR